MEIDPEIPAPKIIPPAIIPVVPPATSRAMPAPVVAALAVPAIATPYLFEAAIPIYVFM